MPGAISGSLVSVSSSVFTATADAVYRGTITLAQIDLPAYGVAAARTLRLATQRYVDPDGYLWDPALDAQPAIDHGGGWLAIDWQPVDCVLTIQDRRLNGQAETETVSTLFGTYPFIGARVQVLQAFDNLTSTADFQTLFDGEVAEVDALDLQGVALHLVQDRAWDTLLPARTVNVDDFPDAPKAVLGAAIPIVLGDWESRNRYLDGAGGTYETVLAGIARGACPMMVVESPTGTGVALPKAIISDDEIDQGPLAGGAPYDQWYMYDPTLDTVVGMGLGTLSNPTDGPATTTLTSLQVRGAIVPIEVHSSNTALYPDEMFRKDKPRNLLGSSYLNWTSVNRALRVQLPDVPSAGQFVSASVYCFYQYPGTAGTVPKLRLWNDVTGLNDQASFSAASSGYFGDGFEAVQTLVVTAPRIASWEDIKNCWIEVALGGVSQEMKVHRLVLVVDYKAQARIERPGTQREAKGRTTFSIAGRPTGRSGGAASYQKVNDYTSPDLLSFDSPLMGFPLGRKDTAAGLYTGTADLLIEHPVDMVRYLLERWCNVSAGEITETSGDFGSFADAKTALSGYNFRTIVSERGEASDHIARIGAESLCWFKRCPTLPGAPWVAVPWELGSPVNYRSVAEPFTFYRARNHVVEGSFSVGQTRISLIANAVKVNYDWDPRTNTYGDQLYITPTASRINYIGDVFGPDTTREGEASDSADLYTNGREQELVLSLRMVQDPQTATSILSRLFDLRVTPRLVVRFRTFVNAYDLNRGHVIAFASDWDSRLSYPVAGSDGSWEGKLFRVVTVKRLKESPIQYAVEAVEI